MSDLFGKPENRFSRVATHLYMPRLENRCSFQFFNHSKENKCNFDFFSQLFELFNGLCSFFWVNIHRLIKLH